MFYQQKKIYRQSHNTSNLPEDQNLHMNISHDSNPPNIKTQTRIDENQEKPKKQKRHEKENSSFNQKQFEKKGANNPSKNNWEYNKYDENKNAYPSNANRRNQKSGQQKNKNTRKPDRQLYIVREKQTQYEEKKPNNENNQKNKKQGGFGGTSPVKGPRRSSNKEESQQFEDDRSFVSNISTTISEKQKPYEDELRVCREIKDDAIIEKGSIMDLMHNTHFHNPQVLFEVSIQNGRTANSVLVWDNEESYETFLDEVCFHNKIVGEMALYLKINLLKMIQKVQPNNKEVEMLLSKLLDWNFEVIKNEIRSKGNISAHYAQTINPVHMNFL